MKLNLEGAQNYVARKGIKTYSEAAKTLGISVCTIKALEKGERIGYDAVKELYNRLGEEAVKELIDFEGESLNGFKSKYVAVGAKLG